jgi:hypothetical protein
MVDWFIRRIQLNEMWMYLQYDDESINWLFENEIEYT